MRRYFSYLPMDSNNHASLGKGEKHTHCLITAMFNNNWVLLIMWYFIEENPLHTGRSVSAPQLSPWAGADSGTVFNDSTVRTSSMLPKNIDLNWGCQARGQSLNSPNPPWCFKVLQIRTAVSQDKTLRSHNVMGTASRYLMWPTDTWLQCKQKVDEQVGQVDTVYQLVGIQSWAPFCYYDIKTGGKTTMMLLMKQIWTK